MTAALYCIV